MSSGGSKMVMMKLQKISESIGNLSFTLIL